jgi:hypothetical protein
MDRGWRIYEGGGGVKGKIMLLCFVWRVAQISIFDVCVSAKLRWVKMARCHIRPDTTPKTIFTS